MRMPHLSPRRNRTQVRRFLWSSLSPRGPFRGQDRRRSQSVSPITNLCSRLSCHHFTQGGLYVSFEHRQFSEAKYRGRQVKPEFSATLKAQGIESDVEILVFIDETGKVTNMENLHESL